MKPNLKTNGSKAIEAHFEAPHGLFIHSSIFLDIDTFQPKKLNLRNGS